MTKGLYLILAVVVALFAVSANAAIITTEDGGKTSWADLDFSNMGTDVVDSNTDMLISSDPTENWIRMQSFTAEHTGTLLSISVQALRLWGGEYYIDIYESFDGDGVTTTSHPSKFRPWDPNWLSPRAVNLAMTVDGDNDIGSGGVATFNLEAGEQFTITTGHAYVVGFRMGTVSGYERFLWEYVGSDVYADGVWGYSGQSVVTGREFAIGYNVAPIPEPTSMALLALGGLAMLIRKR